MDLTLILGWNFSSVLDFIFSFFDFSLFYFCGRSFIYFLTHWKKRGKHLLLRLFWMEFLQVPETFRSRQFSWKRVRSTGHRSRAESPPDLKDQPRELKDQPPESKNQPSDRNQNDHHQNYKNHNHNHDRTRSERPISPISIRTVQINKFKKNKIYFFCLRFNEFFVCFCFFFSF